MLIQDTLVWRSLEIQNSFESITWQTTSEPENWVQGLRECLLHWYRRLFTYQTHSQARNLVELISNQPYYKNKRYSARNVSFWILTLVNLLTKLNFCGSYTVAFCSVCLYSVVRKKRCFVYLHQGRASIWRRAISRWSSSYCIWTDYLSTSLPADFLWGSFVTHSFLPTNEPQRTSAGRLPQHLIKLSKRSHLQSWIHREPNDNVYSSFYVRSVAQSGKGKPVPARG